MVWINPTVDISLIALTVVIFFNLLRMKTQSKELMDKMKAKNKRVRELMKRKDKQSVKEMESLNKELIELNMKIMKKTMPVTLVSLAIFMVIFPFIRAAYEPYVFPLPVPLPWIDFQWHSETNWMGYYFVMSLSLSIIIGILKKVLEKARKRGLNG